MKKILYLLVVLSFILSSFAQASIYIPVSITPSLFSKVGYLNHKGDHFLNVEYGFLSSKVNLGESVFGYLMKLEPSLMVGFLGNRDSDLIPYLSAETSLLMGKGKGISFKSDVLVDIDRFEESNINFTGSMFWSSHSAVLENDYVRGYVSYKTTFINLNIADRSKDYYVNSFRKLFQKKNGLILGAFYQKDILDRYAFLVEYSRDAQFIAFLVAI